MLWLKWLLRRCAVIEERCSEKVPTEEVLENPSYGTLDGYHGSETRLRVNVTTSSANACANIFSVDELSTSFYSFAGAHAS